MVSNQRIIKYDFGKYAGLNSQYCLTKETINDLETLGYINEPYAWLMGQVFKYMLETRENFDNLLGEQCKEMGLDFDLPLVGYVRNKRINNLCLSLILKTLLKRVHVRRGLKVINEAKAIQFERYMIFVRDFYEKYFIKHPQNKDKVKKRVYLVTEDLTVLDELKKFEINVLILEKILFSLN